jgi:hypothetical protein
VVALVAKQLDDLRPNSFEFGRPIDALDGRLMQNYFSMNKTEILCNNLKLRISDRKRIAITESGLRPTRFTVMSCFLTPAWS